MELPNVNYPATNKANPNVVYNGLGSFWTHIFQEKQTLKGISVAHAEEVIQRYQDLVETIDSYSVKDVPVFHTQNWHPILLYKSRLNRSPLVFKEADATFGVQANTDPFYAGTTFQFGSPKNPSGDVYIYDIEDNLVNAEVIAERVLSPKTILTKGVDYIINDGELIFNRNVFDNSDIPRATIVSEDGEVLTYEDNNGNIFEDELIILWAYHAQLDDKILYNAFGYIFDLNLTNNQFYKDVIKSVFNLYVEGPTVAAIKTICAVFLGIPVVEYAEELVEEIFSTITHTHVVTNRSTYKFDVYYNLLSHVIVGATLYQGEILADGVEYCDNVTTPNWWARKRFLEDPTDTDSYLALSKHLFVGNYKFQLSFRADVDLVSLDENDILHFPVKGNAEDVVEFHKNIDTPTIRTALGLTTPGQVGVVNPLDFLFNNFFKTNTILLKFRFQNKAVAAGFLNLLTEVKELFPKHVYTVFSIYMSLDAEEYSNLNDCIDIEFEAGTQTLNADGTNEDGEIEDLAPFGYTDIEGRLFSVAKSPSDPPANAVVVLNGATSLIADEATNNVGSVASTATGILRAIPTGATTATYGSLQLIIFS